MKTPAQSPEAKPARLFKVIACEIAMREVCYAVARSRNLMDLEFLPQGYHDTPAEGRKVIQERVNAVPAGKYDAILIGYGLCSNMLLGLATPHTPLVVPRAHDCITFFLGSKERYQQVFTSHPGTYYYTAGWLECRQRRKTGSLQQGVSMEKQTSYDEWVRKYGEDEARYLQGVMEDWTRNYTRGALIDFDFDKHLNLAGEVQKICADNGWQFEPMDGDLSLIQRWLDGDWSEKDFLIVQPQQKVIATCDEKVMAVQPQTAQRTRA